MRKKRRIVIILILICVIIAIMYFNNKSQEERVEEVTIDVSEEFNAFRSKQKVVEENKKYNIYELTFISKGYKVYGQLYLPNETKKEIPLVIICHGFESNYEYCSRYAKVCADEGMAAYVFDFCGGSSDSRSDGKLNKMSVLTERDDLENVFYGLKSYKFFDKDKIFLMGESQGGLVSAIFASKRDNDFAGLILMYPAFEIPDEARKLYKDKNSIPDNPEVLGVTVGKKYYEDVIDMDIYMEIIGFQNPVLIVHGDADVIAPISYSEMAVSIYKNATLVPISGSNHGFEGESLEMANAEVIKFLKEIINN